MCGVWDGWVVSNPNCPACVRAAFVSSAQLRVRTRILRWVWHRSNPGAARGLTQSVSLSGVRLVDGWVLSNADLCARVRVAAVVSTQTVAPVLAFCVGCGVGSFDPRAARYVT